MKSADAATGADGRKLRNELRVGQRRCARHRDNGINRRGGKVGRRVQKKRLRRWRRRSGRRKKEKEGEEDEREIKKVISKCNSEFESKLPSITEEGRTIPFEGRGKTNIYSSLSASS